MTSRHKAALETQKTPKAKSRANAASGGLYVNVFCSDVYDGTHFVSGTQRVDSVRPFTTVIFVLSVELAAGPNANGSVSRRRCHRPASLLHVCGRPS